MHGRKLTSMVAALGLALLALGTATAVAQLRMLSSDEAQAYCVDARPSDNCSAGGGRKTPGGGKKVSHKGWPRITGIFWQVRSNAGADKTGTALDDELLGHHGSDRIAGGDGSDVIWGDWNPRNNSESQRDRLDGGPGDDFVYPSHGYTTVDAGDGDDYIWAFYGRGVIDCGPGEDRVRIRLNKAFRVRNCEVVNHFCSFGSDGKGGCLKPGEKRKDD